MTGNSISYDAARKVLRERYKALLWTLPSGGELWRTGSSVCRWSDTFPGVLSATFVEPLAWAGQPVTHAGLLILLEHGELYVPPGPMRWPVTPDQRRAALAVARWLEALP